MFIFLVSYKKYFLFWWLSGNSIYLSALIFLFVLLFHDCTVFLFSFFIWTGSSNIYFPAEWDWYSWEIHCIILTLAFQARFCPVFELYCAMLCDTANCIFLLLKIMLQLIHLSGVAECNEIFFSFITAVFLSTQIFSVYNRLTLLWVIFSVGFIFSISIWCCVVSLNARVSTGRSLLSGTHRRLCQNWF